MIADNEKRPGEISPDLLSITPGLLLLLGAFRDIQFAELRNHVGT